MLGDMYRLFESMLGQNMVEALPEGVRKQYLTMAEDLPKLNYEKIGAIFDGNINNYEEVMKNTMKEFAEFILRTGNSIPEHYPVKPAEHFFFIKNPKTAF